MARSAENKPRPKPKSSLNLDGAYTGRVIKPAKASSHGNVRASNARHRIQPHRRTKPLTTFSLFKSLPAEIRDMVYREILPVMKNGEIEPRYVGGQNGYGRVMPGLEILRTDKQIYHEAMGTLCRATTGILEVNSDADEQSRQNKPAWDSYYATERNILMNFPRVLIDAGVEYVNSDVISRRKGAMLMLKLVKVYLETLPDIDETQNKTLVLDTLLELLKLMAKSTSIQWTVEHWDVGVTRSSWEISTSSKRHVRNTVSLARAAGRTRCWNSAKIATRSPTGIN
ncbi:uncharacterized protein BDZ99DRAFT_504614 [Mytilinidion resinicola]|uniref:Uncharacterized protein n=1 Tax=Mytilinidion resinicola TaxID=574789 RepID=A0A6A6XZW1_9PEZI|nr:uncharacterized protein BDZ99DRAFT_504614 [Mytilinidion resinicola]KAF2801505.1 hypothetical protein BDZ99DRAFT_504614 [Mytilinidion resinicola]